MSRIDEHAGRAELKIVFYGPAKSGKTTNLLRLHERLPKDRRGDLVMLDTRDDRTLFFDLLPFCLVAPSGLKVKVRAYTVPGQVRYDATRKAVLEGADGVAFIADSQRCQQANNAENLGNLEHNCALLGIDMTKLPLVVQFNKRDLGNVVPEAVVRERWGPAGGPLVFASALNDVSVYETFELLLRLTYRACEPELQLDRRHGLGEDVFIRELGLAA